MHKKGYPPRPFYSGGPKNFTPTPYFNPETGPLYPFIQKRPDVVGYSGGGGGAGRVSLGVTPQFTSVSGPHPPPNSTTQVQQASQNPQLRAQAPSLPPSQHPHSAGGPPPSVSHSQHLPHPHSALAQHQHHPGLSSGNVSGATGGLANTVQQSTVAVPQGQNSAPPGPPHDLSAQGIQQQSQQIQQGSVAGVALANTVGGTHSMMYPNSNPNPHSQNQQGNAPGRRLINGQQYYHHGQQNMHPGGQQHRPVMAQPNMQAFPYTNLISPIVHPPNPLFHQFATQVPQHRPGTNNPQGQYAHQPAHYHHLNQLQMPGGYPHVENNGKAWNMKNQFQASTIYFQQPQPMAVKAQATPPQREKNIIPIIDPVSKKNILEDMPVNKPSHSPSPMQSRDSSAANTPAPEETLPNKSTASDIPSQFALQVALQVDDSNINNDQSDSVDCLISTNKLEPTCSVLNSETRDKTSSNSLEKVNLEIIKNSRTVPEHSSLSQLPEQHIKDLPTIQTQPPKQQHQQSQLSQGHPGTPVGSQVQAQAQQTQPLPQPTPPQPQQQQPPPQQQPPMPPQQQQPAPPQQQQQQQPQPQRSAKSRGASNASQGNHMKAAPQQQSAPSKQPSPPHHGKQNQTQPKGGRDASSKGNQNNSGQQPKGSSNAQQGQKTSSHSSHQQQSKQSLPQSKASPEASQPPTKAAAQHQAPPPSNVHPPTHVSQQPAPTPHQSQPPKSQGPTAQPQPSAQPPQQKGHGGYRGPSPPQHTSSHGASRRMSGEQPPPHSAAPVKPTDKRSSPPAEHIPNSSPAQVSKETLQKQGQAKSTTPNAGLPANKKDNTPEATQATGKRGKDKANEEAQSKDGKQASKSVVEDAPPQKASEAQAHTKQTPQGKPPKTQPQPNSEKVVEVAPSSSPAASQTPKTESPAAEAPPKAPLPPSQPDPAPVAAVTVAVEPPKEPSEPRKKASEEHVNNVEELKAEPREENHVGDKPKSSSLKINKEGPSSSDNQTGKLQYDRDFLLQMQRNPLSMKRPDSLPNLEVVLDGPVNRPMDDKPKMLSDFTPAFLQSSSRNRIPKAVGRGSQQGRSRPGQRIIDIKLSSSSEVKLNQSENAWKPAAKKTETSTDEDEIKHQDTIKKIRGVLNKLTPDNFERLVLKVTALKIEKFYTFDSVIGLIFEKAVDEQSFSSTYAELCKVLSQMSVKMGKEKDNNETRFRNLLISKCQAEFEKDNSKDLNRAAKEKEIEAVTDTAKKVEMKAMLEYEETRLRKRSVGNIRFIGELYKLKMLTSSIMMRILGGLLDKKDEESLECLCKLLTTIGKHLETSAQSSSSRAQEDLNAIFDNMRKLVESKKTSSRVRFLMMDVIDLRKNNWVARREEAKPKKKAEVHEEEIEYQMLLSTAPRKDDRERKKSRDNRDNRGMSEEGWNFVNTNTRRGPFYSSRLRNTTFNRNAAVDNTVELRAGFSLWARGSSGGMKDQQAPPQSLQEEESRPNNRFAILDSQAAPEMKWSSNHSIGPRLAPGGNTPQRHGGGSFGSKSMPPPLEKENKMAGLLGDRSESNSRSNSRASSRDGSLAREPVVREIKHVPMDKDVASKYSKSIIEEYTLNFDVAEAVLCLEEKFKGDDLIQFIQCTFEWVLDRDSEKRRKVGVLYHHLLNKKLVTTAQFMEGTSCVLEALSDFIIDIPQVCTYVGEIFCRLLIDGVVLFDGMLKLLTSTGTLKDETFAKIIKQASLFMGEARVNDLWKTSGLNWDNILSPGANVKSFLEKHDIEFTVNGPKAPEKAAPHADKEATIDASYVKTELTKLFKIKASEEEIFGWIDVHVGALTNTKKFVRALTTALIESLLITSNGGSVVISEDFERKLKDRIKIIYKYVDSSPMLELPCIYGMQSLSVAYQHPAGMLEQSFNVFYDHDVLSEESFLEWEKDTDPEEQLGKGVCITSVRNFLKWLRDSEETDQPE